MKSTRHLKPINLTHRRIYVHSPVNEPRQDWNSCEIGKNIYFKPEALASYLFKNNDDLVYDAFLLAASIEYCDYFQSRSQKNWGREFTVSIPVQNLEHWKSEAVYNNLITTLKLLTGDKWNIEFRQRDYTPEWPAQELLELRNNSEAVIAYSDGLDSLSVAGLSMHKLGEKLIRVRLGSSEKNKQKTFIAIPFSVRQNNDSKESSGRSRGFKFAVLTGAASYLSETPTIIVTESGQGALGPALVPTNHAAIDYRNHPIFFAQMKKFLTALFNRDFIFEMPQLWHTKGETLRSFMDLSKDSHTWQQTRSCWRGARQVSFDGKHRQCGICAACLLRRMSVHAAGLEEPSDAYFWNNLNAPSFELGAVKNTADLHDLKSHRLSAAGGMAHLRDIAELRKNPNEAMNLKLHAVQVANAINLPIEEVMIKQNLLLEKHGNEWESFLDSLASNSFLIKWAKGDVYAA